MFLEKKDLYTKIRQNELHAITSADDMIILHAMQAAISEMKTYLKERYDVKRIFETTGEERNPLLLSFAVDIAIYEIIGIALPGQDLEDRRARYKRAIDYLKQVRDEALNLELPNNPPTTDSTLPVYGSSPRRENYF